MLVFVQQTLQEYKIEPAVELPPYLWQTGDGNEAVRLVKGDTGGVVSRHPAKHRMEASALRFADEGRNQRRTEAAPLLVLADIDTVLDGVPVTRPVPKRAEATPARHFTVLLSHEHWPLFHHLHPKPVEPVLKGDRLQVPTGGAVQDGVVVNLSDHRYVIAPGRPNHHRPILSGIGPVGVPAATQLCSGCRRRPTWEVHLQTPTDKLRTGSAVLAGRSGDLS